MILLIDNYDSFVYNLARYVRELGFDAEVHRNDQISVDHILARAPSHIILSPGPCSPSEAGISVDVVRTLTGRFPILGICLGHQCIGAAFGARVVRAGRPVHGRTSLIRHAGTSLFRGLPSPFRATRYHSLVIAPDSVPSGLEVLAVAQDDGEIMGIGHREHPTVGLQFHPESAATECGYLLLDRFLRGEASAPEQLPRWADLSHQSPEATAVAASPWSAPRTRSFDAPPADRVR